MPHVTLTQPVSTAILSYLFQLYENQDVGENCIKNVIQIGQFYKPETITSYLNFYESCERKGNTAKKGLMVKPIISSEMNSRCQIDFIDMQAQPDGDYKFICVYQDHLTKFIILRPLKHKSAKAVANDLKIVHGKPRHSQSQGSVERANQDIENMLATWL
ncbi:KRAB-A domain-containing protein 2-like [Aphis craccivora]|uniref:KRAB-A domain-containing protein 2-like n=1 Tax=Aphis craccivora TaxID=307492 RepID=A0A6G0YNY7_APHCR|nr:KRAB-A domain-containing protein 2-like [Aphis craccivora]